MARGSKQALRFLVGGALLLVVVWASSFAYQEYWIRGANRAVVAAANQIAVGDDPPNVHFAEIVDRHAMSEALASGFTIAGFDSIAFSLRDYEVKVRTTDGDQYNFDAFQREGTWHLECCGHWKAADLP